MVERLIEEWNILRRVFLHLLPLGAYRFGDNATVQIAFKTKRNLWLRTYIAAVYGVVYMPKDVPTRMAKRVQGTKTTVHDNKRKIPKVFRDTIKRNNWFFADLILVLPHGSADSLTNLIIRRVPGHYNLVKRRPHKRARLGVEVTLHARLRHPYHGYVAEHFGVDALLLDTDKKP